MINKYITATILAAIMTSSTDAQTAKPVPRLVVNITIDQLRTEYLETFMPYYGTRGFKKLMGEGLVYDNAQYSFSPIDKASAIAAILTGTTPRYNGITGERWFDSSTLMTIGCVDDNNYDGLFTKDKSSPTNLTSTTINDELKIQTDGNAIVYSIAKDKETAILGGGHAADGVFWVDRLNKCWCSSKFYFKKAPSWIEAYNITNITDANKSNLNAEVTKLAIHCVRSTNMGTRTTPDMLTITYDAKPVFDKDKDGTRLQDTYIQLDREIETLVSTIENKVGHGNALFVISATGYSNEPDIDYEKYKIQTGTFYINRTANLLNMYLGAIYGSDKYIEGYYYNQIYLNKKLIDIKRINMSDILSRAQSFLVENAGVSAALTSKDLQAQSGQTTTRLHKWYNQKHCGDLIVEVTPGWKLYNEDNNQQYISKESLMTFPVIFYGTGITANHISTPVTVDRIAPTIAKAIRIRAPNACSATPLY